MAVSYTRRINLYINGKQITNDIASIRAEMNLVTNAQARMTRGSKEYYAEAQKLKYLKGIMDQHRADIGQIDKAWSLRNMGRAFNDYFSMAAAFIASGIAIVMGVKKIIQSFNDFEERLDYLSALTGLSGDNLKWLGDQAKELTVSFLENGIRVRYGAKEIVDAFTKVGSARPELLKNKQALLDVTKNAIILASAAKIELQPAIEGLTMVMNQYNVTADQSRRIINVLAAGSLEGAGEIPYLTVGFEKAGTQARLSGLSIETLAATLETLAPLFHSPEIAGRGLKGLLVNLSTGADDTNPKIVGFSQAIENLGKKMLSPNEQLQLYNRENMTVANSLILNIDLLKYYEDALKGTNTAIIQAGINTDNNNARMDQAMNRLENMSIELGEKLAPALTFSTSALSYMVKGLSVMVSFISEHKAAILTLIYTLTSYTIAVKIASLFTTNLTGLRKIDIAITWLQNAAWKAKLATTSLYNAALLVLKGNLAAATIQFRIFSAAMSANPIGLLVGLLVAAGSAMYFYSKKVTDAAKAQQSLIKVSAKAKDQIQQEKTEMLENLAIAKDLKISLEHRNLVIAKMISMSPTILHNLNAENVLTKAGTDAVNEYVDALTDKALMISAQDRLVEINKELEDIKNNGSKTTFWQDLGIELQSLGSVRRKAALQDRAETQNSFEKTKALQLEKKAVMQLFYANKKKVIKRQTEEEELELKNDLFRVQQLALEQAEKMPKSTKAEIAAYNQKVKAINDVIESYKKLGLPPDEKQEKDLTKERMDKATALHEHEMALINQVHLYGLTSEDQYNADMLQEQHAYLADKLKIYKEGSKEYEQAVTDSLELQVKTEEKIHQLRIDAQLALREATTNNLEEGIEKEIQLEKDRWQEQLEILQKQKIDKEKLSRDEIDLNCTTDEIIYQNKVAHEKKLEDLEKAKVIKTKMDIALIHEAEAFEFQDQYNARREMARVQYEQDILDANLNAAKIAQAKRRLSDTIIEIKQDELNKEQELADASMNAANALLGGLIDIAGKESKLGKALFYLQQSLAIGQVMFNMAIANAKALAAFPLTGGEPWVGINTAIALGSVASIMAQSVKELNPPESTEPVNGFSAGGYTGPGASSEPAGIVHKKEYVIPEIMLRDPQIALMVAGLENFRQNRYSLNPQMKRLSQARSFQSGGYTGQNANLKTIPLMGFNSESESDKKQKELLMKLSAAIEKLTNWKPTISIESYEKKRSQYAQITNSGLKP